MEVGSQRLSDFFNIGRDLGWDVERQVWTVNTLIDPEGRSYRLGDLLPDGLPLDLPLVKSGNHPRTRLIYLCHPSNPTGAALTAGEVEVICAIAARAGAYVISDEIYRGLEWSGELSPAIDNYYERGVSIGSVSKTLGMPSPGSAGPSRRGQTRTPSPWSSAGPAERTDFSASSGHPSAPRSPEAPRESLSGPATAAGSRTRSPAGARSSA